VHVLPQRQQQDQLGHIHDVCSTADMRNHAATHRLQRRKERDTLDGCAQQRHRLPFPQRHDRNFQLGLLRRIVLFAYGGLQADCLRLPKVVVLC
jgi:hypothetical protein